MEIVHEELRGEGCDAGFGGDRCHADFLDGITQRFAAGAISQMQQRVIDGRPRPPLRCLVSCKHFADDYGHC